MSDYRTPTSKVRGLGASGHGAGHWIAHRVSSVAMFLLAPVFVWMLAMSGAPDPAATREFLASPAGAIVTLLTLTAAFYHMRMGMQVVIEDYIHKAGMKFTLLIGNTLLTAGLWLATVFCLVKIAL
ncbi:MAG: succinate dehydrogenase, hydrophobic membrane anchor protein [Maricaulis sp.]|uniref:succinate dehydrogenase, hydrophobic membrane anchor protein n=1 Tax=unclassified Maricaulis TaxID=2632371 RepID=UPI001B0EF0F0|nr:succinate dehydrogenase, hydrophobic membrane anchor protein [Maricaulis sp.]MBO6795578.1 succinate dehydrogenase, hydrophobic membrane anchor protein [Maricaulis sp.]MDM7983690.1 succinate dehydrogenase, hydrophobic membrane anchor protein [Maricaulis sp.]MEC9250761.1 succinate dehydrogenase, hydrophobic membrane anchor protein [Pseudomonadota bacterium]